MKEKELQQKTLCDLNALCKDYAYEMTQEKKVEFVSKWQQKIEQNLCGISPEFFKRFQDHVTNGEVTNGEIKLPSCIENPLKLWMDIYEYSKVYASKFTDLEKRLAGGIFLKKIRVTLEDNEAQLKESFKKLLPNPRNIKFPENRQELESAWHQILKQDFSETSPEFVQWFKGIDLKKYIHRSAKQDANLWSDILKYLQSPNNKDENLEQIAKRLKEYKKEKEAALVAKSLRGVIVMNVYLNGDKKLVKLFEESLPIPRASLFSEGCVPKSVEAREEEGAEYILKKIKEIINSKPNVKPTLQQVNEAIKKLESAIIKTQRAFRGRMRKKEEKALIDKSLKEMYLPSLIYAYPNDDLDDELTTEALIEKGREVMAERNKPYKPKCNEYYPQLANRLLEAAKNIKPFTTIRHLTATDAIPSILDEGLYGRKSLQNMYMKFRAAALAKCDIKNGDADVICFAPFDIDPTCMKANTIEFVLNLDKLTLLESKNPCIFFKQRDLGFLKERKSGVGISTCDELRKITIGVNKKIIFSHTGRLRIWTDDHTNIKFFNEESEIEYAAELHNLQMISSNFEDMYQILAMNFFRFLDKVYKIKNEDPGKDFANEVYGALNALDEKELESTLFELTRAMSDTMEFNFYGSFLMNPEFIKKVSIFDSNKKRTYELDMADFVKSLQNGDSEELAKVQKEIPGLFKSYRFIDYLLLNIQNSSITDTLLKCRNDIKLPLWRQKVESIIPKN